MSDKDIIFFIGAIMGLIGGYGFGHLRGQAVGIKWCASQYSGDRLAEAVNLLDALLGLERGSGEAALAFVERHQDLLSAPDHVGPSGDGAK